MNRRQRRAQAKSRPAAVDASAKARAQSESLYRLGVLAYQQGRLAEAAELLHKAIAIDGSSVLLQSDLGVVLQAMGRHGEAARQYRSALAVDPAHPPALCNMAAALDELGWTSEAISSARKAVGLDPGYAEAHNNLGIALVSAGRPDEAALCYRRSVALKPDYVEAQSNLGIALKETGRPDLALPCYRWALALQPNFAEAHYNESLARFLLGDLEFAWSRHEWRWHGGIKGQTQRDFGRPQWTGRQDIAGRIVLLHAEQGMGDTIQFVRYAQLLADRGATLAVEAPPPIVRLLSQVRGIQKIVARGEALPPFDYHCPLMSLPAIFNTSLATIPAQIPYLAAEPERVALWAERLGASGFKVGITWQGNPAGAVERGRSAPLACFAPLAAVPGVRLISLQKIHGLDQLSRLPAGMRVEQLGPNFDAGPDAFLDTAAVMMSLDLVISIDSATVHLAGALGRPVWVALQAVPHWIWMLGRRDSPWYPTARLFRQNKRGDWPELFGRMAAELQADLLGKQAVALLQSGAAADAEARIHRILAADPAAADALHLGGIAALQRGRLEFAGKLIARAIAATSGVALFHANQGLCLLNLGRHRQARARLRRALLLDPAFAAAWHNLGVTSRSLAGAGDTAPIFRRAILLDPGLAEAYDQLGALLVEQGRKREAIQFFRLGILTNPAIATSYNNLGISLSDIRQSSGALIAYRRALALDKGSAKALNNLATTLDDLGRPDQAAAACRAAIVLEPAYASAHSNLGMFLLGMQRHDAAMAAMRRALAQNPGLAEAYNNLGNALRRSGAVADAAIAYLGAIALRPEIAESYNNLANVIKESARIEQAVATTLRAVTIKPDYAEAYSNYLMFLHYDPNMTPERILIEARRFAAMVESQPANPLPARDADPERRLRIGYVSGDFRRHPVGYFLWPVLANRDSAHSELFCYSNNLKQDDMTERLRGASDHWRSLVGLSDQAAAALIAADQIDILVDLSGHTALNRLPLFARKAAPIQASWLGYWGTTGLPSIDYVLSDAVTVPPGEEAWFSEQVVRLPGGRFCYAAPDYAPPPAEVLPSRRDGRVTFGSFNNLAKVGPEVLRLWAAVLASVPDSRLVVKWHSLAEEGVRRNLLQAFARQGVDAERVELRGGSKHAEMLAQYADIDIALDCFPFSGGLTSCEALWMGVPVVTLPGSGAQSRQTLGFLQALDLADCAATSPEDYVAIAVALAADEERRAVLRRQLRPRMAASPLCDGPAFARRLDAAYRDIWRRWCEAAA